MLSTLLLLLTALNPAWADRYWDLQQAEATQLAEKLQPGTILLTYCPGCDGVYHLVQVNSAQVVRSPQERDMYQVLIERHIIHSGLEVDLDDGFYFADTSCGRSESYYGKSPDPEEIESPREYVDFPYTYILTPQGQFRWLGEGTRHASARKNPPITLTPKDKATMEHCLAGPGVPRLIVPTCDVYAYVTDPDPKGLYVRKGPEGKTEALTSVPLNTIVHIVAVSDGWLRIDKADFELSSGLNRYNFKPGWVYHKYIGVGMRGEAYHSGKKTPLHTRPDSPSAEAGKTRADELTVGDCKEDWLYVIDPSGPRGWLPPDKQCPNPVTTCP
jgi:hypothetical protein